MFIIEVKIPWDKDPCAEKACEWLTQRKYRPQRHWDIDMHGGLRDHTSFWFKDRNLALMFKLAVGGV